MTWAKWRVGGKKGAVMRERERENNDIRKKGLLPYSSSFMYTDVTAAYYKHTSF